MLGHNLKKIRQDKGLSQLKLSKLSGVAQSSISEIESGKSNPNISTLRKLASVLEISLDELLGKPKAV
ncbi:MAG: helix-turn-helix transcriptional regulator [Thermoanaerobacter sp.]|nr:helix-turn-helix transcriptional regulator [Thermoanaerobacter sp.]